MWEHAVDVLKMAMSMLPLAAFMFGLHKHRTGAVDKRFNQLDTKVEKMDGDVDGLTAQLQHVANDVEQRFLTKIEHTQAINRLEGSVSRLDGGIAQLNTHLFEWLARSAARKESP